MTTRRPTPGIPIRKRRCAGASKRGRRCNIPGSRIPSKTHSAERIRDVKTPYPKAVVKQAQTVTTRFPIESDLETDNIRRLSELINEVYDGAESGMWKRKGARTNPAEVERLLRAQALILAEIDGVVVGAVNVNLMRDGVGQ